MSARNPKSKHASKTWALCSICLKRKPVDKHHVTYVSEGGAEGDIIEACHLCHTKLHSKRGDFKRWGQIGGRKCQREHQTWKKNFKQFL